MFARFAPKKAIHTRHLFFTGKGGVGKTSTACATAISLAEEGKKVLIVSTDPASNLQDVFEQELMNSPTAITQVKGLYAANLDPEQAASAYREKVVGPYRGKLPDSVIVTMEEQLSGACTVEIAAFDEFTTLLTDRELVKVFDHIIFDTAPTGHTLRLLQLPTAWSDFLDESTHGASCLGPLAGLTDKKELYSKAVEVLADSKETTLVLVSRPDESALAEVARASQELIEVGISNQVLLINGVMESYKADDPIALAFHRRQAEALESLHDQLKQIQTYSLPLVSYSLTGIENLLKMFDVYIEQAVEGEELEDMQLPDLKAVVEDLEKRKHGVVFAMGKGGVGKTTVASAVAVGLVEKGHHVHLTTTDPAAHISYVFKNEEARERLTISQIDPKREVEKYRQEVLKQVGEEVDEQGLAYVKEDLNSPCTEEIAVFRAFAQIVEASQHQFVVIDTAPTGHTLLLLDAAQSYHKEISRSTGEVPSSIVHLLPRLRNPEETSVIIVTLAEATPVLEAERLQQDLRRAEIHPTWWVINQSLRATDTKDPVLRGRSASEQQWIQRIKEEFADRTAIIPWKVEGTVGYHQLLQL